MVWPGRFVDAFDWDRMNRKCFIGRAGEMVLLIYLPEVTRVTDVPVRALVASDVHNPLILNEILT